MGKRTMIIVVVVAVFSIFLIGNISPLNAADPYVLGYISDITGHARANYAPDSEGFRLYMDLVNSRGGINGHPVKVIIEDGKSEASRSAAVAKKLIIEDKVLVICGLGFSRSQPPVYAMAKKEGVPIVTGYTCIEAVQDTKPGSVIFSSQYIMHPNFFPGAFATAKFLQGVKPKGSTVAFTTYSTPGARIWASWTVPWLKEMGYKVVYVDYIPPKTVDISPWVSKVAKKNPDSYITIVGAELLIPQASALEKLGYTKDVFGCDFVPEGDMRKCIDRLSGNGEWMIWSGRYASVYEDLPEMKKIKKAMGKFGHKFPLSSRHCNGWTIARVIEAALIKVGWPCTRSDLISALEKTDLDTRGLTGGPIRFTPTDHHGPSWWKAYRWNATKKALVPIMDWFKIEVKELKKLGEKK